MKSLLPKRATLSLLPMLGLLTTAATLVAHAEPEDAARSQTSSDAATTEVSAMAMAAMAAAAPPPKRVAPGSPALFTSQDRWQHAGYNLDEIVYTVFIINHDSRILRCRTKVTASYMDDKGVKNELTDLQTTTVFPNHQEQAGIWLGLDEPSGATFKVTCKPVGG